MADDAITGASGGDAPDQAKSTTRVEDKGVPLRRRVILIAAVAGGLLLVWLIGAAVVPRWWAQRIGNTVDGSLTTGSLLGVIIGAVFTFLPLMVLWMTWRFRKSWTRALIFVGVAIVVAAPNLATFGIMWGTSGAAHAGERTLDVDGPGFRGGTVVGAVIGAILAFALMGLLVSRRRNKDKATELEARIKAEQ